MRARLSKIWEDLLGSYWFIPLAMAAVAILLSLLSTWLDHNRSAGGLREDAWFLTANQPEGARELLATIAGSMITVAGVTYSITIAAVSFVAGQFGPRILTQFMHDRGNQVTLGTFIATFVYCLLVLRTVRSAGEGDAPGAFVPHLGVLGALALAVVSVGVLIYFVHHVPDSLHISHVVARVGRQLQRELRRPLPAAMGDEGSRGANAAVPLLPAGDATPVPAGCDGHVHNIDGEGLLRICCAHDLVVRLVCRPGVFVHQRQPLLLAWPRERVTPEAEKALHATFAFGRKRTPMQDPLFLADELVEIAARALSPGVNDPYTAQSCIDWLTSALLEASGRPAPSAARVDAEGRVRVVAPPVDFDALATVALDQLRPYVSRDRNASLHQMAAVGQLVTLVDDDAERRALLERAAALREACDRALTDPNDRAAVAERHEVVRTLAADEAARRRAAVDHPWLFGI